MRGGWVWLVGTGLLVLGYFLGQSSGPAPVEFPDRATVRSAEEMQRAVEEALAEARAFPRAVMLVRLFEGLTEENVQGAARAVEGRAGRWDPVDLQLFLTAWVHVDPLAAIREVERWPIRSRREIGLTIAIREWAASGRSIEAADYFQTIVDPDKRAMAAGPLVRGWALAGDLDGAFGLAQRLWQTEEKLDVVDGFVRGVLHVEGPTGALAIARRVDPNAAGEFEQRLARVTMNLVAREDAPAAAAFYRELAAGGEGGTPEWLGGMLDRIAGLWRNDDPEAVLVWLLELEENDARNRVLNETIASWGIRDFDPAWEWFMTTRGPFPGEGQLDATDSALLVGLVRKLARTRPAEAARWVIRLEPGPGRNAMYPRVAHFWAREDPAAARAWIAGLEVAPGVRQQLERAVERATVAAGPADAESDRLGPARATTRTE